MSGTSADSIDVAICQMKGQGSKIAVELIHYEEHAHDPEVKARILKSGELGLRAIAELNVLLGETFAEACLEHSLKQASISPAEVDIVGSHGQTIYHHSGVTGARRATLQLGDGDIIAVRTGRYVISDFRCARYRRWWRRCTAVTNRRYHPVRCKESGKPCRRVILNLGGIANLTVLDADPTRVFGFDTGPANAPLDRSSTPSIRR